MANEKRKRLEKNKNKKQRHSGGNPLQKFILAISSRKKCQANAVGECNRKRRDEGIMLGNT
jgi:hypothetical protein